MPQQSSIAELEWTLREQSGQVWSVNFDPKRNSLISGNSDGYIILRDISKKTITKKLLGHKYYVICVSIYPQRDLMASGGADANITLWDIKRGDIIASLNEHSDFVWSIKFHPKGHLLASGSKDSTIRLWDVETGKTITILKGHDSDVRSVCFNSKGDILASGGDDKIIRLWDVKTGKLIDTLKGHHNWIRSVDFSPNGKLLASGSSDNTIRLWDVKTGKQIVTLEGHNDSVMSVSFNPKGDILVSGSSDNTIRLWEVKTGKIIDTLKGHCGHILSVSFNPEGDFFASGSSDNTIRLWRLTGAEVVTESQVRYTNAKILLVGDSGVGKSGLAHRLTKNKFKATISTNAAWATQLNIPIDAEADDIDREIWLWDFGGQSDYRLIHQLFMDETAVAILVFDPQSENPFDGLCQWDKDIHRAARRQFQKLLVAGRCDRGGLMVSKKTVEEFCKELGFITCLETSALTGTGCKELKETIINNIPWGHIPYTTSPIIFKLLKEAIIKIKDQGVALLRMSELQQEVKKKLPGKKFTEEQLRAVVGLLAGPGVTWKLEFGDYVLLQPEQINAYAAAVVRSVRANKNEVGSILEERILAGNLDYQEVKRLQSEEEEIVLRAMYQTLVKRGICLREHTEDGTLLVFPTYYKRERPDLDDGYPSVLVTYKFNGALDEIYATLVVKLLHTKAFEMDKLWRFAADFKTHDGKRLGFKMTKGEEGMAEISAYFDSDIPDATKVIFIKYIHEHLLKRANEVKREREYVCPECKRPVKDKEAIKIRLEAGKKNLLCAYCDEEILLIDIIEQKFVSDKFEKKVRELDMKAKINIDNESKELILIGQAFTVSAEAGQIYRGYTNSDHGIDGEIEFKDDNGEASGIRIYLQLKSGDSYLYKQSKDGKEIFTIKKTRHIRYWQKNKYDVYLVIRTSDGKIRWMNVTEYLKNQKGKESKQIIFNGVPFTAENLLLLRNQLLPEGDDIF